MDRLARRNVLAMSGRAVEAAGDIGTLLIDKTGTITYGNRQAAQFIPVKGVEMEELIEAAVLASVTDDTPEGRSVPEFAEKLGYRSVVTAARQVKGQAIAFSAETRVSGIAVNGTETLKGAVDAIVKKSCNPAPDGLMETVELVSSQGGTPLAVMSSDKVLGVIYLKDTLKPGMREKFGELRRMGIRTVMITGDNPVTAKTIAEEAGVDEFVAESTPEDKIRLTQREQAQGRLVAMTGDGTNDAPALAQADVGVAMNSGTAAAREAGNMVDLDNDPAKLIEIVKIGKQLLITRGALTTFSIANDVAKYFTILPAALIATYSSMDSLNVMRLGSPESAILSAVIFNALIIIALVPLAIRGVPYTPMSTSKLLTRNLLTYGLGGVVAPFIGIKVIDVLVNWLHLV
jgi:K+-transporting ATPase ATPase B chain